MHMNDNTEDYLNPMIITHGEMTSNEVPNTSLNINNNEIRKEDEIDHQFQNLIIDTNLSSKLYF